MRASVYRLNAGGARLPQPTRPIVGDLTMRREAHGDVAGLVARLKGDGALEVLPALHQAEISVVSKDGLVIHGTEYVTRGQQKSRSRPAPQTWWVFVLTSSSISRYDGEDPIEAVADNAIFRGASAPKRRAHPDWPE